MFLTRNREDVSGVPIGICPRIQGGNNTKNYGYDTGRRIQIIVEYRAQQGLCKKNYFRA